MAGWQKGGMTTLPKTSYFPLAPDWVCEILSSSTATIDRSYKLPAYAEQKVPYVWILDPVLKMLEVFKLSGEHYTLLEVYAGNQRVHVPPFDAIEIDLVNIWPPEDPIKESEAQKSLEIPIGSKNNLEKRKITATQKASKNKKK